MENTSNPEPKTEERSTQPAQAGTKRQWETPELRSLDLEETKVGISTIVDADGLESGSA